MTIAFLASLAGCVTIGGEPTDPDTDPGDDDDDGGGDDVPDGLVTDGTYRLRSELDVTVEAVLPEPAYDTVQTLRAFSEQPAHTLLDLAEQAGVPAVGTIRDALPGALESRLEGWIDEQIAKLSLNGVPVTQLAAELAALGETALTQPAIDSELTIAGTTATHRLTALAFAGTEIAIANAPGEITTRTTTAQCTDTLALGDHTFAIEYGRYAWQALEQAVVAEYGATPRALLGQVVDCPALAAAVASKCVLSVCVGHQAELTSICERGLDEVVAVVQRKLETQRFDALHFAHGAATFADADANGTADRLADGVWTAELNASQGLRPIPATFAGQR